jgi:hypothetical protein
MKVYVAGASSEMERAEKWMAALRQTGIEVTSTWPEVIRKVAEALKLNPAHAANPMDAPREDRAHWAITDLTEVAASTVFWLLLPTGKPSVGAYCELGYAIMVSAAAAQAHALGIPGAPVYQLICSGAEASIFTALAEHYPTDEEAFRALTLRFALVGSVGGLRAVSDQMEITR